MFSAYFCFIYWHNCKRWYNESRKATDRRLCPHSL